MKKLIVSLIALSFVFAAAKAEITMPRIFSDNMVIQRNAPVKIWGKADPKSRVAVEIGDIRRISGADKDGFWSITLPPLFESDNPRELTVYENGKPARVIENVLVGEVWVSGGQSNMEMTLGESDGYQEAKSRAAKNSLFRIFEQGRIDFSKQRRWDSAPQSGWRIASESEIGKFSAVAYLFGERLLNELKVPVGIIQTSLGGTKMCCWLAREDMQGVDAFEKQIENFDSQMIGFEGEAIKRKAAEHAEKVAKYNKEKAEAKAAGKPFRKPAPGKFTEYGNTYSFHIIPEYLFNAKVAPLAGYTAKGFIWYQGESDSNAVDNDDFAKMFERLIESWRKYWGNDDMPFIFVQLTSYSTNNHWPETRLLQQKAAKELDDVYMAVTIDLGTEKNIHPKDKPEVARRMAIIALDEVYDKDMGDISYPMLDEVSYRGAKAELEFDLDGKLKMSGEARGFEVLSGGVWKAADAKIIGSDKLEVSAKDGSNVEGVRYLWKCWAKPDACLFGQNGLPAAPFSVVKKAE